MFAEKQAHGMSRFIDESRAPAGPVPDRQESEDTDPAGIAKGKDRTTGKGQEENVVVIRGFFFTR